ncbi:hypothetical protein [Limnobacter sp.]|uniref:hypothetical protein n=1 Tax=Limnobacter sp. TaxID=2003368 RepID=UPI003BAD7134
MRNWLKYGPGQWLCAQSFLCAMAVLVLPACTGLNQAALNSLQAAYQGPNRNFEAVPRNPAYQYMQVEVPGAASLTVLGYQYPNLQVWYAAKGEVVRLQGNRLLDTTGLNVNLANVQYAAGGQAQQTNMKFDVPELGLFNVQATLQLQPTEPPKSNLAKMASATKGLYWYSETILGLESLPVALEGLPPAIYGFAQALPEGINASELPTAVYGKQCLAPTYCLEWHRQ